VPCCGSIYGLNSLYLSGPSRCNLKTYRLTKQGNTLYINN
jgi:Rieske Fe-S protein